MFVREYDALRIIEKHSISFCNQLVFLIIKLEEFQYVKFNLLSLKEVKDRVDQFMRLTKSKSGYLTSVEFGDMAD